LPPSSSPRSTLPTTSSTALAFESATVAGGARRKGGRQVKQIPRRRFHGLCLRSLLPILVRNSHTKSKGVTPAALFIEYNASSPPSSSAAPLTEPPLAAKAVDANRDWEVRDVIGKEDVDGEVRYLADWYPALIPCVNRLRKVVFPASGRWKEEDRKLYSRDSRRWIQEISVASTKTSLDASTSDY